jgi:hypothetical protein
MRSDTPCAESGCEITPQDAPLFRVNPKGESGIFMCREHEETTWNTTHEGTGTRTWTLTVSSALPMLNLNQRHHWAKKAQLT